MGFRGRKTVSPPLLGVLCLVVAAFCVHAMIWYGGEWHFGVQALKGTISGVPETFKTMWMFRTLLSLGLAVLFAFAGIGLLRRKTDGLYCYNSCFVLLCLAWFVTRKPMVMLLAPPPIHRLNPIFGEDPLRNALGVISVFFVVGALLLNRKVVRWDLKEGSPFKSGQNST